ncbi:MAG: T9SS type A sorting domain-containing protein [Saprospiraceae bacterium]|nr:T9SS type A sorting domain-containing protein [Saprospiraceae bacterium]
MQRSVNGSTFETIGRVFGVGNSLMESQYVFYDSKPLDNKNYYRLQQVDFNEKDSYSEIVIINRSRSSGEITIQPNPVTDNISYSFISNQTGEATVRILDMSGRTLLQQPKVLLEGNNTFEMDVQSLTKGIYMLQITEEAGNRQVQRFVKQ